MKPTMYLLRGMPGAGKSTFLEKHKLKSNTISLDTFREMYSGLSIGVNGEEGIDQRHNEYVMTPFWDAIRFRMKERATIIIDNLNLRARDINSFVKIADGSGYEVKVVDFPLESFEFYLNRNRNREERKRIPPHRLAEIYQKFKEIDLSDSKAEVVSLDSFEKIMSLKNEEKAVTLDHYNNIVVIGDIHGAGDALESSHPYFDPKNFYIFTGALFGDCKGTDQVLYSLLLLSELNNVVFLRSQSDYLFIHGSDSALNDSEVAEHSRVFDKTIPYFMFSYESKYYFASHAGVSKIPRNPELFNASLFTKKQETENIDQCFEFNEYSKWHQVHGSVPSTIQKDSSDMRSFSVYDRVEFGGSLVSLKISKNEHSISKTLNHQVSVKVLAQYYKTMFKGFNKTTKVDLTKMNKIGSKGLLTLYSDNINTYFTYHDDIVFIEKNNSFKITAAFKNIEYLLLSYSKNNEFLLFNKNGEQKVFNVELFRKRELDLAEQNDCILDVLSCDGVFYVVGGVKKDKERNRLKNKFFNESPIKTVSFDNEKAFKGFKKGMKKTNKPFFII